MKKLLIAAALLSAVATACQPLPVIPPAADEPTITVVARCDNLDYSATGFGVEVLYISITEMVATSAFSTPIPGYETSTRFIGSTSGSIQLDGHYIHTYSVRTPNGVYKIGSTSAC